MSGRCREPRKDGQPVRVLQCCRFAGHQGPCHLHGLLLPANYPTPHRLVPRTYWSRYPLVCSAGAELDGVAA